MHKVWALVLCALVVAVGEGSAGIAALPSDGRLAFSARPNERDAFGWQLFVATPGRAGTRRLTRQDGDVLPSWSGDGSQLVFERSGFDCGLVVCREIWLMNADGTEETLLTSPAHRSESPDWAATGDRIAYVEWGRATKPRIIETDIYSIRTDGRERRRLTRARGEDTDPAWSPDGRRIAFSSDRTGNFELYVMNADGSNPRRLTRTKGVDEYGPGWSPGGRRLAYWRRVGESDAVMVMNLNGTGRRRLSGPNANATCPVWSPDGTRIAYERTGELEEEIWVMSANGRNRRKLVRGPFTEPELGDWGPAPPG